MTTDDILNIDCRKEENKTKLNRFLYNVKPIQKKMGNDKTKKIPLTVLENVLHGICIKYGYRTQGFMPVYLEDENDKTKKVFWAYSVSVMDENKSWKGMVYGKTLWETVAKVIIKIYSEIKKGE